MPSGFYQQIYIVFKDRFGKQGRKVFRSLFLCELSGAYNGKAKATANDILYLLHAYGGFCAFQVHSLAKLLPVAIMPWVKYGAFAV